MEELEVDQQRRRRKKSSSEFFIEKKRLQNLEVVKELVEIPFLDGQYLNKKDPTGPKKEITINDTETRIAHELGRPARGYIILAQNGPALIYRVPLELTPEEDEGKPERKESLRNSVIVLKATETVSVDLWVF